MHIVLVCIYGPLYKITSKNYPFHLIKIKTQKKFKKDEFIDPIMKYLESSEYFSVVQKEMFQSLKTEIASNEQTIIQINSILNEFNNTAASNSKSDKLIYYNENKSHFRCLETFPPPK